VAARRAHARLVAVGALAVLLVGSCGGSRADRVADSGPCAAPSPAGSVTDHPAGTGVTALRYLEAGPAGVRGPVPLVLVLHGSGGTPEDALATVRDAAGARGALVVAPAGTGTPPGWVSFSDSPTGLVDTEEDGLRSVLDDVGRHWCVDPARVFAVGTSNGASMAALLACVAADRFAAVAAVAGAVWPGAPCSGARPVPVLVVQGGDDRFFEGLQSLTPTGCCTGFLLWPPDAVARQWAQHDRCTVSVDVGTLRRWTACDGGAQVDLLTLPGVPHGWPAGGVAGGGTLAERVLAFFDEHPRR
jgi:polyhydroxybutyrate depolymerase